MSRPILYVHVGPSKTGTTFLQRDVLERIESMNCLSVPHVTVQGNRLRFGDLFSFSPEFWRDVEESPIADFTRQSDQDVVISDERISGGLVAPQPWIPGSIPGHGISPSPRLHTHSRVDPYQVSSHFRELRKAAAKWGYDDVRVLLTTRRQDTKLASSYAQLSNRVRGARQENFEKWVRHLLHNVVGHNKGGGVKLNYSLWRRVLEAGVGAENVFFLPFELLREDPAAFLQKWLGFLGVSAADEIVDALSGAEAAKQNVRSQSEHTWALRTPIKKGRYLFRWPDFSRGSKIRITESLTEEILAVYEKGNRSLDEKVTHLRLNEYGYY